LGSFREPLTIVISALAMQMPHKSGRAIASVAGQWFDECFADKGME
jgi:hypothetical protein